MKRKYLIALFALVALAVFCGLPMYERYAVEIVSGVFVGLSLVIAWDVLLPMFAKAAQGKGELE